MHAEEVQLGEDLCGRKSLVGKGVSGAAQLGHVLDGHQSVSDHVADAQVGPAVGQRHHAVPVPTQTVSRIRRPVQRAVLQTVDLDRGDGLGHRMQHHRPGVLVDIDLRAHQRLTHHGGDGRHESALRRVQRLGIRPGQHQRPDRVAAGAQRPSHYRPVSARSHQRGHVGIGLGVLAEGVDLYGRAGADDIGAHRTLRQRDPGAVTTDEGVGEAGHRDAVQIPPVITDQCHGQSLRAGLTEHLILECPPDVPRGQRGRQLPGKA